MSARDTLTPELRAEVLRLEDDLRARVASLPEVQSAWRTEYDSARAAERTAAAWEAWVDERVTLAAVAWVLTTVFIRFCEDNGLVKPVWISGPRSREAVDAQQQFLRETARTNPDVTDREWLLQPVEHLKSLRATAGLVDETSPMWLVTPSGDAATRLLNFWRERDETGALIRELSDPDLDTRFLGDLYQEISEDAKKRYALLQTPVFVEEFILDRTLEPALNERSLEGFKMIDPTCGSGHFLLGSFQRLLDRWHKHAPGLDERERVQAALDSVYGVDLNPFAVAIARFRLTVAALQACGLASLEDAPAFQYHVAAGDSLLHGLDQTEFDLGAGFSADRVAAHFVYATENLGALRAALRNGQYDVVVGNPPYITVKDRALNTLYRSHYRYCKGKYALSVPFMERFFQLAKRGDAPGWIGQITSNSFMKREFGVSVIEDFLPTVDLTEVIDSEGAWIPGHNMDGTPTVIVVGRARRPARGTVRAVLSKGLRESQSTRHGSGPYWQSILEHIDDEAFDNDWIGVVQLDRAILSKHPWSLAGGGTLELIQSMESSGVARLADRVASIGITSFTLEDDVYIAKPAQFRTRGIDGGLLREMVGGNRVRDWVSVPSDLAIFPYNRDLSPMDLADLGSAMRWMWPFRTNLSNSKMFNGDSKVESGLKWWEYGRLTTKKLATPFAIAFAEIAPENNFVFFRREAVFAQTAPIIKLSDTASEDDHLALLAVLNSSSACFWMRDKSKPKGGAADVTWLRTHQYNSTRIGALPLPPGGALNRGRRLDELGHSLETLLADLVDGDRLTADILDDRRKAIESTRGRMLAEQEELDWDVYRLYGLIDEDLTYAGEDLPILRLGERAFEIALARRIGDGAESEVWFERHRSTPINEMPEEWPEPYRRVVERRIELVDSHPFVTLLERPEYKRRWATEPWERQRAQALRARLLGELEASQLWNDAHGRPNPMSVAALADEVARDERLVSWIEVWEGRPDVPLVQSLGRLLAGEGVPYLAAHRYKASGLRKRAAWERTWELQRQEDAGTYDSRPASVGGDGPIPVPPPYIAADFTRAEYWAHRGKLDVPKERFILYPGAGRDGDPTPVLGWGGWDHAQQALALARLIQSGEQQGWSDDRIFPFVAGLSELLPWVEQWHSGPDALYGGSSPAEFFSGLLDNYMAKLGATRESLAAWRPPAPTRGRKAKS